MTFCRLVWELLTGEWWFWAGHPNGGTVVFWRTVQITAVFYVPALVLRSIFSAPSCPGACRFDIGALWHNLAGTLPWVGAIFAAVYVALYARFASQWTYLAGVYNQIRQTLVTMKDPPTPTNVHHLQMWRAGFIEDALDLHLATKPMFAPFIKRLLEDEEHHQVRASFDTNTDDGETRRAWLQEQLGNDS